MPCRHLNVHYNRAFVKNYTRLLFKRDSPYLNRGFRIACDDKAYLRCGTSEGFSRPVHKPLHLSTDDMKFQLPAADYPKSCGYVSPGVIITVNKMDHVDYYEDDKYIPADVTVSVTCKPKAIYSFDSTNWANDIYAHRINFREEHELPISLEQELLFKSVPENLTKTIIFVRDSLLQFEIMSIEDDFIRLKEGGDHLEREMLRLSTLAERVNLLLHFKDEPHCSIIENTFCVDFIKIKSLKQKLDDLVSIISSNVTLSDQIIISSYDEIVKLCKSIRLGIESRNFPKHRAIEVQSSDAGHGVSCHERISQIRFVESFQINNLNLQARVHYAPNDSRSHIAEKAMRALNKHAGYSTTIPLPVVHLTEIESPDKFLAMSGVELKELRKKQEENVALRCAKEVAHRYQGNHACEHQFIQVFLKMIILSAICFLIKNLWKSVMMPTTHLKQNFHRVLVVHTSCISLIFLKSTTFCMMEELKVLGMDV